MSLEALASHKGWFSAEVLAGAGVIAYANHALGAGEIKLFSQADGSGGVPLDGTLAVLGIGWAMLRPASRWSRHALAIGLGTGAGFLYRTGAAMGDVSASSAKTMTHATAGEVAQMPARNVAQLPAHFRSFERSAARVAVRAV